MVFLVLAVVCSLAIGMVFKWAARYHLDLVQLLTVNYGVAAMMAATLLWAGGVGSQSWSPALVGLGVLTGALFIGGFFLLGQATERSGMALALGVMRLSVVVPVAVSWSVWREIPTGGQQVGLVVACAALVLLAWPARGMAAAQRGGWKVLCALFVVGGLVDVLLKTFDETFAAQAGSAAYLVLVFATAGTLGLVQMLYQKKTRSSSIDRWVYVWGIALGLFNYGSTAFLLEAVARMRGTVVFPLNNIAIVLGSALLGRWIWNETFTRRKALGLAMATGALLLLGSAG